MRQASEVVRECLVNKRGRCVFGFANVQADGRKSLVRRDPLKQLAELLKRVRLQTVEIGIQFYEGRNLRPWATISGSCRLIEVEL